MTAADGKIPESIRSVIFREYISKYSVPLEAVEMAIFLGKAG